MDAKKYTTNNQEITEEIKEEIKKYLETNDNKSTMIQNLWDAAKAVLRGKFIAIQSYLKKPEKISNKQSNLTPKGTGERRTKNTQNQQKERNIKIRAEINEIETRKTITKTNKTKSWFFEKIKLINLYPDSSRKRGRGLKSVKLEMKKEKLQRTPQKYSTSKETTTSNSMPIKWTTWKKWTNSQKGITFQD